MLRHKFKAVRSESDGFKFASKKELRRYLELKMLRACGKVLFFLIKLIFYKEKEHKQLRNMELNNSYGIFFS